MVQSLSEGFVDGRLVARPGALPRAPKTRQGVETLDYGAGVLVSAPPVKTPSSPQPLLVMLHGAGGRAADALSIVRKEADARGVLVVAPKSRSATWDILRGGFGPDVSAIEQALAYVFRTYAIDSDKIAVGGFSDGASYALTLGMLNGDLFKNVLAFSPGFSAATSMVGRPKIFISHGRRDTVLPFERTGQTLARDLKSAQYDVEFDVFDGGHKAGPEQVAAAMDWWLNP